MTRSAGIEPRLRVHNLDEASAVVGIPAAKLRKVAMGLGECAKIGRTVLFSDEHIREIRRFLFPDMVRAEEAEAEVERLRTEINRRASAQAAAYNGIGFIYFAAAGDRIKIGFAKNVARRVAILQTGCPEPLKVFHAEPGSLADERALHLKFESLRIGGEWFKLEKPISSYITKRQAWLIRERQRNG